MKRSKKMLILFCTLVVLCGGFYLLSARNDETASVTETKGSFAVTGKTAEEIAELEWTSNDTQWHFVLSDGTWMNADNSAFPVNQTAVQTLADTVGGLTASREFTDVTALEDYGLSSPEFSVSITYADGTKTTLQQGAATPFSDGYYLMNAGQTGTVYTVDSKISTSINKKLADLAVKETIATIENVTRLTIGETLDIVYEEESRTIDATQHWYDATTGEVLDTTKVESLLSTIRNLSWKTLEDVSADDEKLAELQLSEDTAVQVTVYKDEDKVGVALCLGSSNSSGNIYARLKGSRMIYTIASTTASTITSAGLDTLWLNDMITVDIADVQEAVFTTADNSLTIHPQPDDTAEEGENALTEKEELLWTRLTALTAEERSEGNAPEGQQLLTVKITMVSGAQADLIIRSCNVDTYALSMSAHPDVLVSAADVDALLRVMRDNA